MLQNITVVNTEDIEKHCKHLDSFLSWARLLRNEGIRGLTKIKQDLLDSIKIADKISVMPEICDLYKLLKDITVAIDNENDSTDCIDIKQASNYKTQNVTIFDDNSIERFHSQLRVLGDTMECYKGILIQQQEIENTEEKLRKIDVTGGFLQFMVCFSFIRKRRQKKDFVNCLKMKRLREREKQLAIQMKEMEEIVNEELTILLKTKIFGGLADLMKIDFDGNFKSHDENIRLIEEATMNVNQLVNKILYMNAAYYNYLMPPDDYTVQ